MGEGVTDDDERDCKSDAFDSHEEEGSPVGPPSVVSGDMPGEKDADDREGGHVAAGGAAEAEEVEHKVERDDALLGMPGRVGGKKSGAEFVEDDEREQEQQALKGLDGAGKVRPFG